MTGYKPEDLWGLEVVKDHRRTLVRLGSLEEMQELAFYDYRYQPGIDQFIITRYRKEPTP